MLYSDFSALVSSGNVQSAHFETSSNRIYFTLKPHSSIMQQITEREAELAKKAEDRRLLKSMRADRLRQIIFDGEGAKAGAAASPAAAAAASGSEATAAVTVNSTKPRLTRQFFTVRVPEGDPALVDALRGAGVRFGAVSPTVGAAVSKVLLTLLALWVPLLPMILIFQRQFGGGGRKKDKGKGSPKSGPPVTFADVAGVPTAKAELLEAVMCLKDAQRYSKLNARMPSGVLLSGPPGTGKTLLAKAVAGEAGTPFFSASASEFVEMYVGRGAARVRELFAEARKAAPSVVFIDELDAVGARRGMGFNEERDQTLNQLLTELDGFEGRPGVLVLAATNRPDTLDPALLRPGRLTRQVRVPLPDEVGRAEILKVHLARVPVVGTGRDEAAEALSKLTQGCSGAELANVVNEGALMAGRKGMEHVSMAELLEGVSRTRFGVDGGRSSMPQWAQNMVQSLATAGNKSVPVRNAM